MKVTEATTFLLLCGSAAARRVGVNKGSLSADADSAEQLVAHPGDQITRGGRHLSLTFQDEFNEAAGVRDFTPGNDANWEAIDLWYKGTWDDEIYKPSNARVADGHLTIDLTDTPGWDRQNRRMHKFTSAMLQSWNKVCFTGGYFEVRLKLPGTIEKGGVWGAAWMAGNLGRPGFMGSSEGMWPYSYNNCDQGAASQRGLDTGTDLDGQKVSACEAHPGNGFHHNQGRGMPEIDLIESFVPTFGNDEWTRAHFTTSLQMGPLIPIDVNHGPGLTGCEGNPRQDRTYEDCEGMIYYRNHTEKVVPNHWCQVVEGDMRGNTVQDCLSSEVDLRPTHFSDFHTYGFLWEPKERVVWYMDGEPLFEAQQIALSPKQSPSNPDFYVGQRDVPEEPMEMLLNVAISDHGVMNWNRHMTFPISMEVDYVRVYQDASKGHTLGCSPASHPTADYIENNKELFGMPICGNSHCEDGECESCESDCRGNMACPAEHLDEHPVWGGSWWEGVRHGHWLEPGCSTTYTDEGVRIQNTGIYDCRMRRPGLLGHGPLEETRNHPFDLLIETEGHGEFEYAVTIGPAGTKCNPRHRGCPATHIMQAELDVALCADCEGSFNAPGLMGQSLSIDLTYRFPYFVGAWGAELRLSIKPGADITFKRVRFGNFGVTQHHHEHFRAPTTVQRGYWEPEPCNKAVGSEGTTCGERMIWLMSSEGGGHAYDDAHHRVAEMFPAVCRACILPQDPCERPACEWAGQEGCPTCASRMLYLSANERRWSRLREEEAQEFIAQQWPKVCGACTHPVHACDKQVCTHDQHVDGVQCPTCAEAQVWYLGDEGGHKSKEEAHALVAAQHPECGACDIQ